MSKKNKYILIVLGIILCSLGLRLFRLDQVPAILNRDEAALAYNGLLLQQVGQDEWGKSWPLVLQSFGDYKLPGYPVILAGLFSLFGANDVVAKLPSVLAGSALIGLAYFFSTRVLKMPRQLAALSAFFVALQPVFFFYSRIAFEANVALTLFVGAIVCIFHRSSTHQFLRDFCATLFLVIAIFTYNTPLLLLPFIIPLVIFWRGITDYRRWIPIVAMLVIVCGIGFSSLLSLSKQKSGITIFSDESYWQQSVDYHLRFQGITQKLLGNKYLFFGQVMAKNYLATFSPTFLIEKGGSHPWHTLPGFGHLLWMTYGLGLVGIGWSLRQMGINLARVKKGRVLTASWRSDVFLASLLVLAPLPAVITVDAPHATRSLLFFFVMTIYAGVGLMAIYQFIRLRWDTRMWAGFPVKKYLLAIVILLTWAEGTRYMYAYFQNYDVQSAVILRAEFPEAIQQLEQQYADEPIAIIDGDGFQYILLAWYLKVPPQTFFTTIQRHLPDKIGFRYGYKLLNYRFIVHDFDKFPEEKTLLWWNPQQEEWQVRSY